ncbi:MAG: STAS domain-containing protein [Acidimicrobiales bacterium]
MSQFEPMSLEERPFPVCQVELRTEDDVLTLEIRGTLDASSVPALAAQFEQLQCTPYDQAVMDVRGVDVIDHVGCHAIAQVAHFVRERGGHLVIRCVPGAICGILASTGLSPFLEDPATTRG